MAAPKRNRSEIARDRRLIAHLYLSRGLSQSEIADRLNAREDADYQLSRQMISYDLCRLQARWRAGALKDVARARGEELSRIGRLEAECWDAWERSQEDAEMVTEKGRGTQDGVETTIQRKGQVGDPRFLDKAGWCVEQRCKILGIYEATRLVIDWQQEAREAGLDPADVFERYVQAAAAALDDSPEAA